MENHFSEINIERFRGIKNLSLTGLKRINVLLGDNNSGKTSLLECIRILGNPAIKNILQVCNQRNTKNFFQSYFSDLIYAFPRDDKKMSMHLSCKFDSSSALDVRLSGNVEETLSVDSLIKEDKYRLLLKPLISSIKTVNRFNGKLLTSYNNENISKDIVLTPFDMVLHNFDKKDFKKITEIIYLDSINSSNLNGRLFKIDSNEKYKEICIQVLRLFDKSIEDIVLLNDDFGISVECIKSNKVGIMPVTNYGDGVRKIVSIAEAISAAHGGVLLIDEFETGIHARNYNDIFNFIIKACRAYKIQLFVTTHSIEAVDELLNIEDVVDSNEINFITLKKDEKTGKTLSRILSPKDVKENRTNFGFEVRL